MSAPRIVRQIGLALLVVFGLLSPMALRAQAGAATDVVFGRVTDAATGAPVERATVSATSLATGSMRSVQTSPDGRYVLVFADGGGRYVVRVRRLGYSMATFASPGAPIGPKICLACSGIVIQCCSAPLTACSRIVS